DLVLPKGSLEAATLRLFEEADLPVRRSSDRDYSATIPDPRIGKVKILRPQEIAQAVEHGYFDLGITGHDWVLETDSDVYEVMDLGFNRASNGIARIVLAVPGDSPIERPEDVPPGWRISTEYLNLTRRFFARLGIPVEVSLSYGATEAKIPELADAIVDITETGSSLRRAGFKIIGTLAETTSRLIANHASWQDPAKRQEIIEIQTLLAGVLTARGKVLIKMNVSEDRLQEVINVLPAMKAPTVSRLFGTNYYAVEAVAVKANINLLIPELKKRGAEDILELPISKIVP
ncbi:MAG TPA: ATP phosphoribosyltransferase, partial [Chloroflexota bacterium]|nr:ATP phosphoribosyltransferase [Chloroflexota bacterium]